MTSIQGFEQTWTATPTGDPIARLRQAYPWPEVRPQAGPVDNPGWLAEGTDQLLASAVSPQTRVVVELGVWLGMSTRHFAKHAPNATVISIDHWNGSPEHQQRPELRAMLPTLYDTFLSLCWDDREQIIPLRMSTLEGLRTVASFGIEPDLIFIDAEHSYPAVTSELELAHELFPKAQVVGDDFDWTGVRDAVTAFAMRHDLGVERRGTRGWSITARSRVATNGHTNGNGLSARARWVVLVPHLNGIESPCEDGLRELELAGIRVIRRRGSSLIDLARSEMVSDALHDGFEAMLFIDSDLGFDPADAIKLFERPEPVVSGVYAKKGPREVASAFVDGTKNILFGPEAPGLYPLKYAATGFMRIRSEVLRRMIDALNLPLCNTQWGRGVWPFFIPCVLKQADGRFHYLGEDWAFSHRLAQIGVVPMADTSFRLYHYGVFGYSWEEVGTERPRYRTYSLSLG